MKKTFKAFQAIAVVLAVAAFYSVDASAQAYPTKSIRIILGFEPGGGIDVTSRLLARKFSDGLGQSAVVENRTGAGGAIATEAVVRAQADGHTLLMLSSASTTLPAIRKLPFDTERDLAPISMVAAGSSLLVVNPSVKANNVKELIALARSQPGKLKYGSSGIGSATHFMAILFTSMADVDILHIPFKGSAGTTVATASGQVDMSFFNVTAAQPLISSGKVRALATISAKRLSSVPSIPTLDESGVPGYDYSIWYGLLAPVATPKQIITQLNTLIGREMNTAEMTGLLNKQSLESRTSTPEEFASIIRRDLAVNAKLVKLADVKDE